MVDAMLDLVKDEWSALIPLSGTGMRSGNFIVKVLLRKLAAVERKSEKSDSKATPTRYWR